ncbi:hypothetical protein GCM10027514_31050 [Azotobacter armeniacus]
MRRAGSAAWDMGPHGHWKTTTFVCELRSEGLVAPLVRDGPINGQALAPILGAGDIVVQDNLGSHEVAGVREAVEAREAELRYLLYGLPRLTAPTSTRSGRCSRS